MTVLNETNAGRVTKITDMLQLVEKSAQSNKASQEDLWQLLDPVVQYVQKLLDADSKPDAVEETVPTANVPSPPRTEPTWATLRRLAEEAPLKDLLIVHAVFFNRVDELVNQKG